MRKNLYYRTMFQRRNMIKEFILNVFLTISSYPRMILEVFLRKNFGERYFSFATGIIISIILAVIPFAAQSMKALMRGRFFIDSTFLLNWTTWYLFIAAFIYVCVLRRREIKRNPSVFDFKRFSLYSGNINDWFLTNSFFGKPDVRRIETLTEPSVCALAGVVLMILGQPVGMLIIIICYAAFWYFYSSGSSCCRQLLRRPQ